MYWDDDLRIVEHTEGYDQEREIHLLSLVSECLTEYITMQNNTDDQGMRDLVQTMAEIGRQAQSDETRWAIIKVFEAISGKRWWE